MSDRPGVGSSDAPTSWASDVLLDDGSCVRLRRASAQDIDLVAALIRGLTDVSRYGRFLSAGSSDSQPYLADLGSKRHVGLVAEVDGKVVGVGEFLTIAPGDCAEVAFALADAYQGLGLGTALLEHLATLARSNGIRRFVGSTLADNRRMMSVFADSGFDMKMVTRTGVVEVALDLAIEGGASSATAPVVVRPTVLGAARAFAVMSGVAVALALVLLAGLVVGVSQIVSGERIPLFSIAALVAILIYVVVVVPWTRRWGTVRGERTARLPGDEVMSRPGLRMTRAVTVDAPPAAVWPWLAQIGADRGGFYSYSWLENLAGCRLRNTDRVHPEWQQRIVGDLVMLHPMHGIPITRTDAPWSFAMGGWYFVLEAQPGGRTRLLARTRVPKGVATFLYSVFIELPHFVMERKMLLGIRQRAESAIVARQGSVELPADAG